MSVLGDKNLENKFRALQKVADMHIEKAVENACRNVVSKEAKLLCPVNHGELRRSIRTTTQKLEEGGAVGEVYTDKQYAMYVEYGTGPVGEKSQKNAPLDFNLRYTQEGWWIPSYYIDKEDAEKYHFRTYDTGERNVYILGVGWDTWESMRFYYTEGQAAQPFMYPALHNNHGRVLKNMNNYIQRKVRESIK